MVGKRKVEIKFFERLKPERLKAERLKPERLKPERAKFYNFFYEGMSRQISSQCCARNVW